MLYCIQPLEVYKCFDVPDSEAVQHYYHRRAKVTMLQSPIFRILPYAIWHTVSDIRSPAIPLLQ